MKIVGLVLFCLLMFACGGGGSGPSSAQPPTNPVSIPAGIWGIDGNTTFCLISESGDIRWNTDQIERGSANADVSNNTLTMFGNVWAYGSDYSSLCNSKILLTSNSILEFRGRMLHHTQESDVKISDLVGDYAANNDNSKTGSSHPTIDATGKIYFQSAYYDWITYGPGPVLVDGSISSSPGVKNLFTIQAKFQNSAGDPGKTLSGLAYTLPWNNRRSIRVMVSDDHDMYCWTLVPR